MLCSVILSALFWKLLVSLFQPMCSFLQSILLFSDPHYSLPLTSCVLISTIILCSLVLPSLFSDLLAFFFKFLPPYFNHCVVFFNSFYSALWSFLLSFENIALFFGSFCSVLWSSLLYSIKFLLSFFIHSGLFYDLPWSHKITALFVQVSFCS